jgi:hypothetical protein
MKKHTIAGAVVAVLALTSQSASAESFFQIEAGLGGSAYAKAGNGLWMQDGFAHNIALTAPATEVGLTGDILSRPTWGIAWHVDWVWLGTIHSDAMVPSINTNTTSGHWNGADFVDYNVGNPCSGTCTNLSRFSGSGHDQGFIFALEPYKKFGAWRIGLEFGPYLHSYSWAEDVFNWYSGPGAAPTAIHVQHSPKWQLGAMAGASIGYKNLSIAYQYFYNKAPKGESVPPIWQGTHVLMATYRF